MRLYLIRHGQSVNNALYEAGQEKDRIYDPDLTETGHKQAQHVANFLAETPDMPGTLSEPYNLTHLYCSAMTRAMQTAQPIAATLNMKPEVWVDIHEIGGLFLSDDNDNITGFPGPSRSEISEKFPNYILTEAITEAGWWDAQKGAELPPDFMTRAIRVAEMLRDRAHLDERIAIVSHAGFLDVLIKAFLRQIPTHPNSLFYTHYNTAITRIDFGEGYQGKPSPAERLRLHYLNRVNHLPPELWTW